METIWSSVKEDLKRVIDEKSYSLWVKPLKYLHSSGKNICLECSNNFSRDWIQEHYSSIIYDQLYGAGIKDHKLIFKVSSAKKQSESENSIDNIIGRQLSIPNMPKKTRNGEVVLNKRFTFDKFVVGECNEFAYSVSKALANDSHMSYSSLFLLSETGLGKSHLIQSIGNSILNEKPEKKVLYATLEEFTNEMVLSLKSKSIEQFKNKYRKSCDVLLLEGMHFLSGKKKTQAELSYTLDSLFNDGKKVIFTSPLAPKEIPDMESMLSSRLASGIITNIAKPDFLTRLKILKQKTAEKKITIPEDVAGYLAENLINDIRQIEGALDYLKANSLLMKRKIGMGLAKEIVKHIAPFKKIVMIDDIQEIVCKYFRITPDELKSKSRKKIFTYPRSIVIYLCRKYTDKSLKYIGGLLNRNHTTVLYDDEKIKSGMKNKDAVRKEVAFLCRQIESKMA
jgi:chromosomal replication initiator protein